jgi:hypothetical protein
MMKVMSLAYHLHIQQGELDDAMKRAFNNNEEFMYALKSSFESFINERENKPAELVAKVYTASLNHHLSSSSCWVPVGE